MVNQLLSELSALPQIEAIALGGSRAGAHYDQGSDYDIYLYCTAPVPERVRREILEKYCSYMEIGNHFWEYEDNCTLKNGIDMDILYRDLDEFVCDVADVVEGHHGRNGYTTCMWHNLLTCKILWDKEGRLTQAKKRFDVPYPSELKQDILDRNWKLLRTAMPAYSLQIQKAAARKDMVSINHRVAAFLESYFDLLFALNEKTHPGEKRLMQLCRELCPVLPDRFEENLTLLLRDMFSEPESLAADLDRILTALAKIL